MDYFALSITGFTFIQETGHINMVDFQGISAYTPGESSAEKRRVDSDSVAAGAQQRQKPLMQNSPYQQVFNQPIRDYSTLQFQSSQARSPLVQTSEPVKLPNVPIIQAKYAPLFQNFAGNLERVISQIGAFFFGQRRNRLNDEEMEKRRMNDFFSLDFLGGSPEGRKVEASNQSAAGDGSQ